MATGIVQYTFNGNTYDIREHVENRDPGSTDDIARGFVPGTRWINNVTNDNFLNLDNTLGAAIWYALGSSPFGAVNNFTATVDPTVNNDSTENFNISSTWYNTVTQKQFVCFDATVGAAVWKETTNDANGTSTMSNIGSGGIGIFKQKTGANFEMKNINAGSNKITVTDDTGNNELDIDVVEANIVHQNLSDAGTNTHAQIDSHIASTTNPHAVTKAQVGLSEVENLKINLNATVAPTAGDDSTAGYSVGSRWIDTTNDKEYVCVDATATAAVWIETTGTSSGDVTGPVSSIDQGLVRFNGTTGKIIEGVGVRHYGASATDPPTPTPQDGDQYYNTAINHEMRYDGSRSKWLSVATLFDGCGRNGNTAVGIFYRRFNGMIMAANQGPNVQKGTIIRIGYSTNIAATHTLEVLVNGAVVSSLASGGAATAFSNTLNDDFSDGIMSMRNAAGGNTTNDMQATIYYKLRV